MGLNRFAKGFFDPLIELYRPVPPLAWAPLIISVLGIDNTGKVFLLFMVSLSIMIACQSWSLRNSIIKNLQSIL